MIRSYFRRAPRLGSHYRDLKARLERANPKTPAVHQKLTVAWLEQVEFVTAAWHTW